MKLLKHYLMNKKLHKNYKEIYQINKLYKVLIE